MSATLSKRRTAWLLYLKIFVCMAIPFGVAECVVMRFLAPQATVAQSLWLAATGGALFGGFMSVTLGTVALRSTRSMGPGSLTVRQLRTVELLGDRSDVLRRVAEAVGSVPRIHAVRADATAGRVEAQTGWSWKSFGERITASTEQVSPGTHRVVIESRPRLRTTIVDYGANAANADAIAKALS